MNRKVQLLVSVIRRAFDSKDSSPLDLSELSENDFAELYYLSRKQDVAPIVAHVLLNESTPLASKTAAEQFEKQLQLAYFQYSKTSYERESATAALEATGIPFIHLKGASIAQYYPEGFMRPSCDLDILVREKHLDSAIATLKDKLGYRQRMRGAHDISLYSVGGTHIELHFSLKEMIDNLDRVLEKVWDYAAPIEDGAYEHRLTNEFLLFYVTAHMAYHFVKGGSKLKNFIDLYLLEKNLHYHSAILENLLTEASLDTFYRESCGLMSALFSGNEPSALQKELLTRVLQLDAEETENTKKTTASLGSRIAYATRRVFLPAKTMKEIYPVLHKHPILLPFYEVKRLGKLFNPNIRARSRRRYAQYKATPLQTREKREALYEELKLKD